MNNVDEWDRVQAALVQQPVCWVEVVRVQGSAPRATGAWMAVQGEKFFGTIGGGHLEWEALRLARAWWAEGLQGPAREQRLALGPSLGQCCGGAVTLRLRALHAHEWPAVRQRLQPARAPVALFGAGHVGRALVQALQPLPFDVHWIDSREAMFPVEPPPQVRCEVSEPVEACVPTLASQSLVLVMSFSHAEDLAVVAACLARQRRSGDLPFIGLIGSASKRAVFAHRLEARGFGAEEFAQVTCPIGLPGVPGKAPEHIAVAVAAQLLQLRHTVLQQT